MVRTTKEAHDHMSADFAVLERETQNDPDIAMKNQFMDRIESAEARAENERAADISGVAKHDEFSFKKPAKFQLNLKNSSTTGLEFPVLSDHDLSTLYCIATAAPAVVWNYLKEFCESDLCLDSEVNEQEKVVFGNFYKTPQTCSFSATVAQKKDSKNTSYVDVRRLQGDAFLLNDFFKKVQNYFAEKGVAEVEEEAFDIYEMDDDDYENLFMSDDEDGDFDGGDFKLEIPTMQLDPFSTMMEFEHDKSMLHMMVTDFKDTHMEEKNYYMSMLSHNAVRKENRELMLDGDMDVQMKDLIETQLQEKRKNSNASLTRDTCLLLKNLACQMSVDEKTIEAACEAMGRWCPRQNAGSVRNCFPPQNFYDYDNIGELTGSRQSMIELSHFFTQLVDNNIYSEEKLLEIVRNKLDEEEINTIGEFASSRVEDSLQIFAALTECN